MCGPAHEGKCFPLKNLLSGQFHGAQATGRGLAGCSVSEFLFICGAAWSENSTGQKDLLLDSCRRWVWGSRLPLSRFSVSQHVSPFHGLASPEQQRSGSLWLGTTQACHRWSGFKAGYYTATKPYQTVAVCTI